MGIFIPCETRTPDFFQDLCLSMGAFGETLIGLPLAKHKGVHRRITILHEM